MFGIGATELIIIMVVALLVFGPKRLPELARSLGRGMAEFRRASSDLRQTLEEADPPPETLTPLKPAAETIAPPPPAPAPPENAEPTTRAARAEAPVEAPVEEPKGERGDKTPDETPSSSGGESSSTSG